MLGSSSSSELIDSCFKAGQEVLVHTNELPNKFTAENPPNSLTNIYKLVHYLNCREIANTKMQYCALEQLCAKTIPMDTANLQNSISQLTDELSQVQDDPTSFKSFLQKNISIIMYDFTLAQDVQEKYHFPSNMPCINSFLEELKTKQTLILPEPELETPLQHITSMMLESAPSLKNDIAVAMRNQIISDNKDIISCLQQVYSVTQAILDQLALLRTSSAYEVLFSLDFEEFRQFRYHISFFCAYSGHLDVFLGVQQSHSSAHASELLYRLDTILTYRATLFQSPVFPSDISIGADLLADSFFELENDNTCLQFLDVKTSLMNLARDNNVLDVHKDFFQQITDPFLSKEKYFEDLYINLISNGHERMAHNLMISIFRYLSMPKFMLFGPDGFFDGNNSEISKIAINFEKEINQIIFEVQNFTGEIIPKFSRIDIISLQINDNPKAEAASVQSSEDCTPLLNDVKKKIQTVKQFKSHTLAQFEPYLKLRIEVVKLLKHFDNCPDAKPVYMEAAQLLREYTEDPGLTEEIELKMPKLSNIMSCQMGVEALSRVMMSLQVIQKADPTLSNDARALFDKLNEAKTKLDLLSMNYKASTAVKSNEELAGITDAIALLYEDNPYDESVLECCIGPFLNTILESILKLSEEQVVSEKLDDPNMLKQLMNFQKSIEKQVQTIASQPPSIITFCLPLFFQKVYRYISYIIYQFLATGTKTAIPLLQQFQMHIRDLPKVIKLSGIDDCIDIDELPKLVALFSHLESSYEDDKLVYDAFQTVLDELQKIPIQNEEIAALHQTIEYLQQKYAPETDDERDGTEGQKMIDALTEFIQKTHDMTNTLMYAPYAQHMNLVIDAVNDIIEKNFEGQRVELADNDKLLLLSEDWIRPFVDRIQSLKQDNEFVDTLLLKYSGHPPRRIDQQITQFKAIIEGDDTRDEMIFAAMREDVLDLLMYIHSNNIHKIELGCQYAANFIVDHSWRSLLEIYSLIVKNPIIDAEIANGLILQRLRKQDPSTLCEISCCAFLLNENELIEKFSQFVGNSSKFAQADFSAELRAAMIKAVYPIDNVDFMFEPQFINFGLVTNEDQVLLDKLVLTKPNSKANPAEKQVITNLESFVREFKSIHDPFLIKLGLGSISKTIWTLQRSNTDFSHCLTQYNQILERAKNAEIPFVQVKPTPLQLIEQLAVALSGKPEEKMLRTLIENQDLMVIVQLQDFFKSIKGSNEVREQILQFIDLVNSKGETDLSKLVNQMISAAKEHLPSHARNTYPHPIVTTLIKNLETLSDLRIKKTKNRAEICAQENALKTAMCTLQMSSLLLCLCEESESCYEALVRIGRMRKQISEMFDSSQFDSQIFIRKTEDLAKELASLTDMEQFIGEISRMKLTVQFLEKHQTRRLETSRFFMKLKQTLFAANYGVAPPGSEVPQKLDDIFLYLGLYHI